MRLIIAIAVLVIFYLKRKTLINMCSFDKKDWKHIFWLFGIMIKNLLKGDFHEAHESYLWIKIHCEYESKRIE